MILPCRHHTWHARIVAREPGRPWLLLLHGFLGCMESLAPLAHRLTNVCNPILLDLPGHGETSLSDGRPLPGGIEGDAHPGFHTEAQISDLLTILERLQTGPVWLYGYSMGGRLALQWAVRHPDLFHGLVLESTTAGIEETAERTMRRRLDRERATAILEDFPAFLDSWETLPLFRPHEPPVQPTGRPRETSNPKGSPPSWIPCKQHPEALAASLLGFGSGCMPPVWDRLPCLGRPVLLINGSYDTKFDSLHQRMETRLPRSVRRSIDGAAHRVHRDRPDEVAEEIITLLSTSQP